MTTDNTIIIYGGLYNDIKKALKQWINLYSDDLQNDLIFKLYRNEKGNYVIKADERLDNDRFFYLVNYLNYPEGIEYKINIEGYTIGKDNNELKNKELLIYISPNDTEGDNVFAVTTDNESYKIDFGGKILSVNDPKLFKNPDNINFDKSETIKLNKNKINLQRQENSKDNIEKRFRIISYIALALLIASVIAITINHQTFYKSTFFLGMGLGVWFFGDYKMLQVDRYYNYCFFIGILFLGYGLLIKQFININLELVDLGSFYPLSLLLVQKPLRLIFKQTFNREPVIDKPPPTFWDGVYTILLFLAFAVLPFIIMDNLK